MNEQVNFDSIMDKTFLNNTIGLNLGEFNKFKFFLLFESPYSEISNIS